MLRQTFSLKCFSVKISSSRERATNRRIFVIFLSYWATTTFSSKLGTLIEEESAAHEDGWCEVCDKLSRDSVRNYPPDQSRLSRSSCSCTRCRVQEKENCQEQPTLRWCRLWHVLLPASTSSSIWMRHFQLHSVDSLSFSRSIIFPAHWAALFHSLLIFSNAIFFLIKLFQLNEAHSFSQICHLSTLWSWNTIFGNEDDDNIFQSLKSKFTVRRACRAAASSNLIEMETKYDIRGEVDVVRMSRSW